MKHWFRHWVSVESSIKNQPDNPVFRYQEKFAPYGDKEAFEIFVQTDKMICYNMQVRGDLVFSKILNQAVSAV